MKSGIIKALFLEEHYKTHHRYLFPESSSGEILRDSFGKTGGNKHFTHLKANKTQWIFNANIKGNLRSVVAVSYLSWYHWCSQMLFDITAAFKSLVVWGAAYSIHPAQVALWPFSKPRGRFDSVATVASVWQWALIRWSAALIYLLFSWDHVSRSYFLLNHFEAEINSWQILPLLLLKMISEWWYDKNAQLTIKITSKQKGEISIRVNIPTAS